MRKALATIGAKLKSSYSRIVKTNRAALIVTFIASLYVGIAGAAPSPHFGFEGEGGGREGFLSLSKDATASGGLALQFDSPTCPQYHQGTWPNCFLPPCPEGQVGTYPNCSDPAPPTPSGQAEVIAFCGVHPDDPSAATAASAMASVAQIDATMGPCLPPPPDYTATLPGSRYIDREAYRRLVTVNANAGMKTLVYDPGIWNGDPNFRAAVINFWSQPMGNGQRFIDYIWAWDMGDEFFPHAPNDVNTRSAEWNILVERWTHMIDVILPQTGVGPYTNHLGYTPALDAALRDLKCVKKNTGCGAYSPLSFDLYVNDQGESIARSYWYKSNTMMCYVNALSHVSAGQLLIPSSAIIQEQMKRLRSAGCTSFGIFGGHTPYGRVGLFQPDPDFGQFSLVTSNGTATDWANGVRIGSQWP